MAKRPDRELSLEAINAELRMKLDEAEDVLSAIRDGHVDALVIGEELYKLESAVAASNRFRGEILAMISDIVVAVDRHSRITYLNPAAEKKYGVKAAEVLGKKREEVFEIKFDSPDGRERSREEVVNEGHWRGEVIHVLKDGTEFAAEVMATDLRNGPFADGILAVIRDITDRKKAEADLKEAHDGLESRVKARTRELASANRALKKEMAERIKMEHQRTDLLQRIVSAQEDERRRIARDIHDQLGQRVTALRLQLASVPDALNSNGQIELLKRTAMRLDSEVSFLAWELRPAALDDLGLPDAARAFVEEWSHNYRITTEFDLRGWGDKRLRAEAETHLYRILQEALNNVAKHSEASFVNVLFEWKGQHVTLIVEDNGHGFDHGDNKKSRTPGGFGLLGMMERATLIGGTMEVESAPGKGTTVFVRVPAAEPKGR